MLDEEADVARSSTVCPLGPAATAAGPATSMASVTI